MKNKIIASIIVVLALSIIKMGLEYVLKAEECKSELQEIKMIEENDLKIHQEKIQQLKNTLKNAKQKQKIDYNFNGDLDNDFLLQELK
jgi:hypothetical protein